MVGRAGDLFEIAALFLIDATPPQQMEHADDAIHRRADFMAHVGEESCLGAGGLLGLVARGSQGLVGLGQGRGTLVDLVFQRLTVGGQFVLDPSPLGDILLDRQIVRHLAGRVADRRDDLGLDVSLAILAPVYKFATPDTAGK